MGTGYTLHIKNMVCHRCILIVRNILASLQIVVADVRLGSVTLPNSLEESRRQQLADSLKGVGLEIIESRVNGIIEEVKKGVRDYLALGIDAQQYKLSGFIAARVSYEFSYVSDLFSKVEGITVERYFMMQRIEKVKEFLVYDQLSLSEISFETGFSSVHHLSSQFKKLVGMTPSQFKQRTEKERLAVDRVGA